MKIMETSKVSIDFSMNKYTDKELLVKASYIISQMTGNTHFPSPIPVLNELTEGKDNFNTSLMKVVDGNHQDTVEKNNRRLVLENLLRMEGAYVQSVSLGSEEIILTSGFDTNKKASPVGPLPMVTGIAAKSGLSRGSLEISWNVVPHTNMYEIKYTEAPINENSVWVYISVTKHKIVIEGFVQGKQYAFLIAAAGSDPSRNWSDVFTSFVM
jgi:hypothetical protein